MNLETLFTIERNARRVKEIVSILGKYGLADWLSGLKYSWMQSWLTSQDGQRIAGLPTEERIRLALIDLGTTFIKLGQMLSTRPDLVGPALAKELSHLQAGTPPDPPEVIIKIFEEEIGRHPRDVFARFDEEAFASASIAQVHQAQLRTGEVVVVKIQRANIHEKVARDLDILMGLAELAEKHSNALRPYQPTAIVRQFRRTTLRELDFTNEKRHIEQFTRNFEDDDTIRFPAAIEGLCTRRVLTMDRLIGISAADETALRASGVDLNAFARRGANMYLNMIFRDGFYHADPHPGNLMLLEDGVLGVLDCGMVGRIDESLRDEIEAMLLAAVETDADQLTEIVLRLGSVPPSCNREELSTDINDFVGDFVGATLKDFDLSAALNGLVDIIRRYHILFPSGLSMLLKVLVMLEGTSRRLDRNFSLAELMQPFYVASVRRRLAPRRILQKLQRTYRDWERLADLLPRDLADIMGRLRSGTFSVGLEHRRIETSVNRLIFGILTASLFLGSSMLWSSQAPPLIAGVSVFGAVGYLLASYLGYRLLVAIHRSGNMWRKDD